MLEWIFSNVYGPNSSLSTNAHQRLIIANRGKYKDTLSGYRILWNVNHKEINEYIECRFIFKGGSIGALEYKEAIENVSS